MSFALRGTIVAGERRPSRFGRSTPNQEEWRTVPKTWAYPEEEATSREMHPQYDTRFRDNLAWPPKSSLVDVNPEPPPTIKVPKVELGRVHRLGLIDVSSRDRTVGSIAFGVSAVVSGLGAWAVLSSPRHPSGLWNVFEHVGGFLLAGLSIKSAVLSMALAIGSGEAIIREEK